MHVYDKCTCTREGRSPAGPGNFRLIDAAADLEMGVVTPLPVGVQTRGVACRPLVGVCMLYSGLCGVENLD